jgi:hypothetical protein
MATDRVHASNLVDRVGYDMVHPDVDGRFPPLVRGGHGLEGEADRWDSVVSTTDLLAFLRHDKHVKVYPARP